MRVNKCLIFHPANLQSQSLLKFNLNNATCIFMTQNNLQYLLTSEIHFFITFQDILLSKKLAWNIQCASHLDIHLKFFSSCYCSECSEYFSFYRSFKAFDILITAIDFSSMYKISFKKKKKTLTTLTFTFTMEEFLIFKM